MNDTEREFYTSLARYQRVTVKTMNEITRQTSILYSLLSTLAFLFNSKQKVASKEQQYLSRIIKIA